MNILVGFFGISLFGLFCYATSESKLQDLSRECFWSKTGGTVKFDVFEKACSGINCPYKKIGEYSGSNFSYSDTGSYLYGVLRHPYSAPHYGYSHEIKREKTRYQCYQSMKDFCRGEIEIITTKLGNYEACVSQSEEGFYTLTRWSIPNLPYDGTVRMEYMGRRYDLAYHPVFEEKLRHFPTVKVTQNCFQVFSTKYCEGDQVVLATTMELVDVMNAYLSPEMFLIKTVSPKVIRFQQISGYSSAVVDRDTRDVGLYILQKKCASGICPGARVRIEAPRMGSCLYSPADGISGPQDSYGSREFEFIGFIGQGTNYGEVWKLLKRDGYPSLHPQFNSWPNSKHVVQIDGSRYGLTFNCIVTELKK